jgi:hypothetical protein
VVESHPQGRIKLTAYFLPSSKLFFAVRSINEDFFPDFCFLCFPSDFFLKTLLAFLFPFLQHFPFIFPVRLISVFLLANFSSGWGVRLAVFSSSHLGYLGYLGYLGSRLPQAI